MSYQNLDATKPLRVLIVGASPEPIAAARIREACSRSDFLIGCDGGCDYLLEAGFLPDLAIGDFDSVSDACRQALEKADIACVDYPTMKDDTDLALAIAQAEMLAEALGMPLSLDFAHVLGGRPDHELAVYGLLLRHASQVGTIISSQALVWLLDAEGRPQLVLEETGNPRTFSVVGLSSDFTVSEQGSVWELEDTCLGLMGHRGISNVQTEAPVTITCSQGTGLVFLIHSDAAME